MYIVFFYRCATSRGEMFMFQAHRDKPVLTALISGDSANALEQAPNDIIVYQIMNFLSAIFGPTCPKEVCAICCDFWWYNQSISEINNFCEITKYLRLKFNNI